MYSVDFLHQFGQKVHAVYAPFHTEKFVQETMAGDWNELPLKQRFRRLSTTVGENLPARYEEALGILFAIDEECVGFPYLFFPDFVEVYGQAEAHWERSMEALERFTSKSSAEFAVRSFILENPERMLSQMTAWADHPNEHVRRLASEGCRPRLPWGQALPLFKHDPTPLLPILELLKADPSLYVRKSVANNLNDIAKDNPSFVLETARRWKGTHAHTDWIIRHGCRTLIRKANPVALTLFGYAEVEDKTPLVQFSTLSANPSELSIGENCELRYELHIREGDSVRIRIEYGIDFVKSAGRTSRKLFLLSDKTVHGGVRLSGTRIHRWADLTTRRHYPGEHNIVLLVNGQEIAQTVINLKTEGR
ncbi:MAG: hypothetical protein JWN30_2308 [Bacilli bacterium]|nr:hypothetical protein [Bacilli bacterium]